MKVKDLLTEKTWTRNAYARDVNDNSCRYDDPVAVKWCLIGAVNKCYFGTLAKEEALEKLKKYCPNYVSFNDTATWAQLKEILEKTGI